MRSDTESTSHSLLRRIRSHDAEAWRRLTLIYGPLVYHWARQAGLQGCDAADVGQDVFQVVVARIDSFQHDLPGATFRGWLRVITRNKLKEFGRGLAEAAEGGADGADRFAQLPDAAGEAESDQLDAAGSHTVVVQRALNVIRDDFDPHTWQAFWRTTVDEQPAPVIAEELGMSAGAVRQAKYRVLHRLRQELDELL